MSHVPFLPPQEKGGPTRVTVLPYSWLVSSCTPHVNRWNEPILYSCLIPSPRLHFKLFPPLKLQREGKQCVD